jgi:hypothetical protein
MRLRCMIGMHDWEYTPAVYNNPQEERLALPAVPATRKCRCCPVKQVEDKHCLGLNPPEYSVSWRTWRPRAEV